VSRTRNRSFLTKEKKSWEHYRQKKNNWSTKCTADAYEVGGRTSPKKSAVPEPKKYQSRPRTVTGATAEELKKKKKTHIEKKKTTSPPSWPVVNVFQRGERGGLGASATLGSSVERVENCSNSNVELHRPMKDDRPCWENSRLE